MAARGYGNCFHPNSHSFSPPVSLLSLTYPCLGRLGVGPPVKIYYYFFLSTEAVMSIVLSGTTWLMCTGFIVFVLPSLHSFFLLIVLGMVLFIVPVVNHIGIFIAIRRHNRQVVGALSGNTSSIVFRREKKAAIDMIIVIAALLLCLAPGVAVDILRYRMLFPDKSDVVWLCSTSLFYLSSFINPVI